ncbi:hypothetical protein [Alishewanella sp. HL-SH06]|uniref:hypothetical protein n=1 Tax=Alishewanella sp. HL-SH06 TaxID=3461144 RepID=UPI004041B864
MFKYVFFVVFFAVSSAAVSASEAMKLFACDTCSVLGMQQIAESQAPLLQCESGINPETGVADVEYWLNNSNCYAPTKELLVANPETRVAFKFRVKTHNPNAGESGYVMSLPLSDLDHEIITAYFDIHSTFYSAVEEFNNTYMASGLSSSLDPARGLFNAAESSAASSNQYSTLTNNTASSPDATCKNSAAAHLFSSLENKKRLKDDMRNAIIESMGRKSWRQYTTTLETTGNSTTRGMTISIGTGFNVQSTHSVTVDKTYIEQTPYISPVGAQICSSSWFGERCEPANPINYIQYKVSYAGNFNTKGTQLNQLDLIFDLNPATSVIDGYSVRDITGHGSGGSSLNIQYIQDSCLAKYINDLSPGDTDFVGEGPLGMPYDYDFGSGMATLCEQQITYRACTNTGGGTAEGCHNLTFTTLKPCSNP